MDNDKTTLRDLLALANQGRAAEFTTTITEALADRVRKSIAELAGVDPEEDQEFEFDLEDDIEDVPAEDDVDLDEESLEERNALNHQKARAFRAGVKQQSADQMSTSVYRSSRDSRETHAAEVEKRKASKTSAQAKAHSMFAGAQKMGVGLGGKSRTFGHIRDAGKKVVKGKHGWEWKRDQSTTASNASEKEYHGGQGKYLHRHLTKQHDVLRRKVDDLHNDIRRSLDDHARVSDNKEKYGDPWRFNSKEDGKPGIEPHHLDNIKKLHSKLTHLHHAVKALHVEDLDFEAVWEDLEAIEAEFRLLTEGHSFSNKDWDDDSIRPKGKGKVYGNRQIRRKWKFAMEDVEPGTLNLDENITDEELRDLAEVLTNEHFELLTDDWKERILAVLDEED